MKFFNLVLMCAAWLGSPILFADDEDPDRVHGDTHEHDALEEVLVTATPLSRDALEMTQSASVLSDENLNRAQGNSLGDTLKNMPGVTTASFGANVGRPVIRGMDATRVGVLENNMASNDVSKVSQDHAVSIEPFMADQIEVLRGPATLLYGSDTIGGVVNVRTNRIPVEPFEEPEGRALIQMDGASGQRYGVARQDWGDAQARFGFHADAFYRRTDDYDIPGFVETDPEPGEQRPGELFNSALDNQGGALGASWFGEAWRAGLGWSVYDSQYGIPGEGHHHEGEEAGAEEEGEEEAPVSIDMRSRRVDAEVEGTSPFSGVETLKLLLSHTDYTHTEFEGDEVGTVFDNDTLDGRLELTFEGIGRWQGVTGIQYRDRDFVASGEEAFVPPSQTSGSALFMLNEFQFEQWRLDAGLRLEDVDTQTLDGRRASHSPVSLSAGVLWHATDSGHFAINVSRAERAPGDQELFADGPHVATQTFEVGDAGLGEESADSIELSYRQHAGRLTGSLSLFRNDFDDFIYLDDTGLSEDGLPVRQWRQQDAVFEGGEIELRYDLGEFASGHWQLHAFADRVTATLDNGQNVPRIPPRRIGFGVEWDHGCWAGDLSWIRAARQDRTGPFESPTAGFDQVDADLSCQLPSGSNTRWTVFVKASNLLDEDMRNHTSFKKDDVLLPGRNLRLFVRATF